MKNEIKHIHLDLPFNFKIGGFYYIELRNVNFILKVLKIEVINNEYCIIPEHNVAIKDDVLILIDKIKISDIFYIDSNEYSYLFEIRMLKLYYLVQSLKDNQSLNKAEDNILFDLHCKDVENKMKYDEEF